MFLRNSFFALLLFCVMVCPFAAFSQTTYKSANQSAKDVKGYLKSGGFRSYEIGNGSNDIYGIIDEIYDKSDINYDANVIVYTESNSFVGTVIQVTDGFVVLLDQVRVNPNKSNVNNVTYIARSKIVAISAIVRP